MNAPEVAVGLGHDLEWDPPFGISSIERWTCRGCGDAVLVNRSHVYGSATVNRCVAAVSSPGGNPK